MGAFANLGSKAVILLLTNPVLFLQGLGHEGIIKAYRSHFLLREFFWTRR